MIRPKPPLPPLANVSRVLTSSRAVSRDNGSINIRLANISHLALPKPRFSGGQSAVEPEYRPGREDMVCHSGMHDPVRRWTRESQPPVV